MRPAVRASVWLALYLVLLLGLPAAFPPAPNPTYYTPNWTSGNAWAYDVVTSYEGSRITGSRVQANVTSVGTEAGNLTAQYQFGDTGPQAPFWPFTAASVLLGDGDWTSFEWTCPAGRSWANLSTAAPIGFSFPVTGPATVNASLSAQVGGACAPPGAAVLESEGGVSVEVPPGGSAGCTLYVCDQLRLYPFRAEVSLTASGGSAPFAAWTLRGVWDPTVSGFRFLSASPGLTDAFENRSVNLTLASSSTSADEATPSWAVSYAESALLVLGWPLLAAVVEYDRLRRIQREAEEEEEAAVLAAVPDEAKREAESDAQLDEETATRGPG